MQAKKLSTFCLLGLLAMLVPGRASVDDTHIASLASERAEKIFVAPFTSVAFLLLAVTWTWHLADTLDFRPGGILRGKASDPMLAACPTQIVLTSGEMYCMTS